MKRSQKLRNELAKTIEQVRCGAIGPAISCAIARLGDVEVKSVIAEISYRKNKTLIGKIDFFEDEL